jgi:hypothetical protein
MERRKIDGIRHASARERYVAREKGTLPLEGLPEGLGESLREF